MNSKRKDCQFNRGHVKKLQNIAGGSYSDVQQDVKTALNQDDGSSWAAQTPKLNAQTQPGGRGNGQVRAPKNTWAGETGGGGVPTDYNYNPASNPIPLPLESGCNWNADPSGSDNELFGDEYDSDESHDSDESQKPYEPYEVRKKFADFFETFDNLTVDQINEPQRQWPCPACRKGCGTNRLYRIDSLVTHATKIVSRSIKGHRALAEILKEDLKRKGATVSAAGKSYGKWKGLNEGLKDRLIIWPPMVVIMNTRLEQGKDSKWLGMGNQELLEYFPDYRAVKGRHSYGPEGHRGMGMLIFETSALGYLEADLLREKFEIQGTDRVAWNKDKGRNLFYSSPGGKRQLYGFLATKEDLDNFNRHSNGKERLKFELVSYQQKVVDQLRQMNDGNRTRRNPL